MTRPKPLRVAFRVDAALWIGTGHIMRCSTLAKRLRELGATVSFFCRTLPGDQTQRLESEGFDVHRLMPADAPYAIESGQQPPHVHWLAVPLAQEIAECSTLIGELSNFDWIIVDHYALDHAWEKALEPYTSHLMVIDDLADRAHNCDLLLDQNFYQDMSSRYDGLVPKDCKLLLGPQYALFRPEFEAMRASAIRDRKQVHNVLVTFGGMDAGNMTGCAVEAISLIGDRHFSVDIVIGTANPHRAELLHRIAELPDVRLHIQTQNMAKLMAQADLALSACGSTAWESCLLGLPSILVVLADNQRQAAADLAAVGAAISLGDAKALSPSDIACALQNLIYNPQQRQAMAMRCREITSGNSRNVTDFLR